MWSVWYPTELGAGEGEGKGKKGLGLGKEEKMKFREKVAEDARRSGWEVRKVREFGDGRGVEVLWKRKKGVVVGGEKEGEKEMERVDGSSSGSGNGNASGSGNAAGEMRGLVEGVLPQVSFSSSPISLESRLAALDALLSII